MAREFTSVLWGEVQYLMLNCPPGWSKSEMCKHFVAWAIAHYPDSRFLYISYSSKLAARHTGDIKAIIELPLYKNLFGVKICPDSRAKDNFKTVQGGEVRAFGSGGSITGMDSGLVGVSRFSGATIMDDMHKPDEVHSDSIREGVWQTYQETIMMRPRNPNVPVLFVGQRLHEDDMPSRIENGMDGFPWKIIKIKGKDDAGNPRFPEVWPLKRLNNLEDKNPYVFASQVQQTPIPAGGGLFKSDRFVMLEVTPKILATFFTIDTAETEKTYNDPTVFSFWGLYKLEDYGQDADTYGLHWIDCRQIWVEPDELEAEFKDFYVKSMAFPVKPKLAGIEKKSTGVTLSAILKNMRGLDILNINRTKASGSKTARFIEAAPFVNSRCISLPKFGEHTKMCVDHCKKITANDSHSHDDIADTLYDAIKMALIDKTIINLISDPSQDAMKAKAIMHSFNNLQKIKGQRYGHAFS